MLTVGHRGADNKPENTLAAFAEALEQGATAIEIDVHPCATGELVVIHDGSVDRTTDGKGKVSEMTFEELRKLDAGDGEKIPTLQEVLDLIGGKATVFIEPKFHKISNPATQELMKNIHDAVAGGNWQFDQLPVVCQNHTLLYAMRRQSPEIHTGASLVPLPDKMPDRLKNAYINTMIPWAKKIGASIINPNHRDVTPEFVAKAQEAGLKVSSWTANEEQDAQRLMDMGLDAIITDNPGMVAGLRPTPAIVNTLSSPVMEEAQPMKWTDRIRTAASRQAAIGPATIGR